MNLSEDYLGENAPIQEGIYALVGATACLAGVFRSSISLIVIIIEGRSTWWCVCLHACMLACLLAVWLKQLFFGTYFANVRLLVCLVDTAYFKL